LVSFVRERGGGKRKRCRVSSSGKRLPSGASQHRNPDFGWLPKRKGKEKKKKEEGEIRTGWGGTILAPGFSPVSALSKSILFNGELQKEERKKKKRKGKKEGTEGSEDHQCQRRPQLHLAQSQLSDWGGVLKKRKKKKEKGGCK